jgi:hypothetical protein
MGDDPPSAFVHTYFFGLMCVLFGSRPAPCWPPGTLALDHVATGVLPGAIAVWGSSLVAELCAFDPCLGARAPSPSSATSPWWRCGAVELPDPRLPPGRSSSTSELI